MRSTEDCAGVYRLVWWLLLAGPTEPSDNVNWFGCNANGVNLRPAACHLDGGDQLTTAAVVSPCRLRQVIWPCAQKDR